MKVIVTLLPLALAVAACEQSKTATTNPDPERVAADNTKKNVRDRSPDAVTPGDQKENKQDLSITQEIRQQVMKKDLSTTAKNIKIITMDGKVTLRGPVITAAEKADIASLVQNVEGVKQVDNQLEVATK